MKESRIQKQKTKEEEEAGWSGRGKGGEQIHCPDGTGLLVVSAYKHCNDLTMS